MATPSPPGWNEIPNLGDVPERGSLPSCGKEPAPGYLHRRELLPYPMDYRPPTLRWVPTWVWRAIALLLWLGILYSLGSWLWSYLSG